MHHNKPLWDWPSSSRSLGHSHPKAPKTFLTGSARGFGPVFDKRSLKGRALLVGLVVVCGFPWGPACAEPSFTIGPYLQNVTETSIVLCWESDVPSDGTVEYWVEGTQSSSSVTVEGAERHEVALGDLQPGTAYRYRVRIPKEGEGRFFTAGFRTVPTEEVPISFVVYGDTRTNHADHRTVVNAIRTIRPAFVINTGDLVLRADNLDDWKAFWGIVAPPDGEESLAGNVPYFPAVGNHEYRTTLEGYKNDPIVNYQSYFVLPPNGLESEHPGWSERFYSFQYGPAFVIVLDLNSDSDPDYDTFPYLADPEVPDYHPGSPQYEWLINRLQIAKAQSPFTFVCFHPSPYSSGLWGSSISWKARFLDPLFRQYGVDAVFTSHDHFYERCQTYADDYRVLYFVAGAGGAPLYSRSSGWDEPGSWMWDELNQTFYTKAFDNTTHSFIRVDMVPLGNGSWQATFLATRPDGEVFDVVQIRRPWGHVHFEEGVTFSFEAIPGETYRVDYSNDLPDGEMEWQTLEGPLVADGPFVRVTDDGSVTGTAPSDRSVSYRFYRVRQLR